MCHPLFYEGRFSVLHKTPTHTDQISYALAGSRILDGKNRREGGLRMGGTKILHLDEKTQGRDGDKSDEPGSVDGQPPQAAPAIKLVGIEKRFGPVVANKNIDLTVRKDPSTVSLAKMVLVNRR